MADVATWSLAADTLVLAADATSWHTASALTGGVPLLTYDVETMARGVDAVAAVLPAVDTQPLQSVVTQSGNCVTVSADTPLATLDGWRADDRGRFGELNLRAHEAVTAVASDDLRGHHPVAQFNGMHAMVESVPIGVLSVSRSVGGFQFVPLASVTFRAALPTTPSVRVLLSRAGRGIVVKAPDSPRLCGIAVSCGHRGI
jgi:hypothetical protein